RLGRADLAGLEGAEKTAFLLNVYNALTIDGIVSVHAAEKGSVLKCDNFWATTAYRLGGHVCTLDDIEHGFLRCNQPHPATKKLRLEEGDPRRVLVEPALDPRLHFALNCGAKSCPPIRVFSPAN